MSIKRLALSLSLFFWCFFNEGYSQEPEATNSLSLVKLSPSCESALILARNGQVTSNASKPLIDRLELFVSNLGIEAGNAEKLAQELEVLIDKGPIFKSRFISHVLYEAMKAVLKVKDLKESAAHLSNFNYQSEDSKKKIINFTMNSFVWMMRGMDLAGEYFRTDKMAKSFAMDLEKYLAMLTFWRSYAISDPALYKMRLALIFVMFEDSKRIQEDWASFNKWRSGYAKSLFSVSDFSFVNIEEMSAEARLYQEVFIPKKRSKDSENKRMWSFRFQLYNSEYSKSVNWEFDLENLSYFDQYAIIHNIKSFTRSEIENILKHWNSKAHSTFIDFLQGELSRLNTVAKNIHDIEAPYFEKQNLVASAQAELDMIHSKIQSIDDELSGLDKGKAILDFDLKYPLTRRIERILERQIRAHGKIDSPELLVDVKNVFVEHAEKSHSKDLIRSLLVILEKSEASKVKLSSYDSSLVPFNESSRQWILWLRSLCRYAKLYPEDRNHFMDLVEMKFATSFAHVEHSHLMTSYFVNKEDWSAGAPLIQQEPNMGEKTAPSEDDKIREHKEELNQKRASLMADLKVKEAAFALIHKELIQLKNEFESKRLDSLKLLVP